MGFGFSKVVSYGNALTLDSPDFLEYFITDDQTKMVCAYLEGVKDGRRLTGLVRELYRKKPVIVWKAGLTSPGARAASSHTGSLAGQAKIWSAFFKQTGAIKVDSVMEMAEIVMTFLKVKPTPKTGVALLVPGGGPTVASGDICAEEGLDCPALSLDTQAKLKEYTSSINQGLSNPLDVPGIISRIPLLQRTLDVLANDPVIDVIIIHIPFAAFIIWPDSWAKELKECILNFNQRNHAGKSAVIAILDNWHEGIDESVVRGLRQSGMITYGSLRSGCRALRRFAKYNQYFAEYQVK